MSERATGYTNAQAYTLIRRLDTRLAKAEDALAAVCSSLTDHGESAHLAQEAVRETADRLAAMVARRCRKPIPPRIARLGLQAIRDELAFRADGRI